MQDTLFSGNVKSPLADRLRPTKLEEVVDRIISSEKMLHSAG